jgi:hypothetical protein
MSTSNLVVRLRSVVEAMLPQNENSGSGPTTRTVALWCGEAADEIELVRSITREAAWLLCIAIPNPRLIDDRKGYEEWKNRCALWLAESTRGAVETTARTGSGRAIGECERTGGHDFGESPDPDGTRCRKDCGAVYQL